MKQNQPEWTVLISDRYFSFGLTKRQDKEILFSDFGDYFAQYNPLFQNNLDLPYQERQYLHSKKGIRNRMVKILPIDLYGNKYMPITTSEDRARIEHLEGQLEIYKTFVEHLTELIRDVTHGDQLKKAIAQFVDTKEMVYKQPQMPFNYGMRRRHTYIPQSTQIDGEGGEE